ncbi:MAG: alpha-galactosidase [Clostridia bacterium]|nr:alpha-galactosidase [Clostridia bacterium]
MIRFNQKEQIFHLQTKNTSYVFCISDFNSLEHLYYGKKIPDDNVKHIGNRQIYGHVAHEHREKREFNASVQGFEIAPFNSGDIRTPSVIYNCDGNVDCNRLRYRSHQIYKGRKQIDGMPYSRESEDTETLQITLTDDDNQVEFTLFYTVFQNVDVIARHQTIKNTGKTNVTVQKFASACVDFYGMDYDVITLEGMYIYERAMVSRNRIKRGTFKNESLTGTTSHCKNPFIAICSPNADEEMGEVYGFNLVYSGNFSEEVSVSFLGDTRVLLGISDVGLYWTLKPNESLCSPEAVMTYSNGGIGQMSRNFHDHVRQSIIEKEFVYSARPIVINSWEASYFAVSEDKVLELASSAKDCGIDTVVLDDGWFRPHDKQGLGDWRTDKERFPSGIKGLADKIHAMGLKFGLWLEPEMVNENSELYKTHPEYVLTTSKTPLISRHQYILDLTRDEVVNLIADRISQELEGAEIDYIKWDFNRYATEAGSFKTAQGEVYHRQMLGSYKLLAILKQRLGKALFETCCGGGGRFDLGMLYYSPQIWTSDNTDPYARVFIQNGTSVAYPVSTLSCHFTRGDCTSGRESTYEFRYNVASFGSYGYELDLSEYSSEDKKMFKGYSEKYREIEDLNLKGDLYRIISPESGSFCAYMKVSKQKDKAYLTFLELNATGFVESTTLRLKGLDPDKQYKNEESGVVLYGSTLMNVGIRIGDLFRKKRSDGYSVLFTEVKK